MIACMVGMIAIFQLQCSIPVFEGLLPNDNAQLLKLLYHAAEWHAFAKLRMHSESTLKHLETITTKLGNIVRDFEKKVCSKFTMVKLPREAEARKRRGAKSGPGPATCMKTLNLSTYKWHALGDYVYHIRLFGGTDGFSTQIVCVYPWCRFMPLNNQIFRVNSHTELSSVDAHSQVIAAEYNRLLRGVQGASTGEVCPNIQGRWSVVK